MKAYLTVTMSYDLNNFPKILTQSHNLTFNTSDIAQLTCHVTQLGSHHVTWLKYDSTNLHLPPQPLAVGQTLFTVDKRYSILSYATSDIDTYWTLEIYQIQTSDEGLYECKINNRKVSVSSKVTVTVQVPMEIHPSNLYAEPGTRVALYCNVYINEPQNISPALLSMSPSITWRFNESRIERLNDVIATPKHENNMSISHLIIRKAQIFHSGLWTCNYKRQRRSAILHIKKGIEREHDHHRTSALLSSTSSSTLNSNFYVFLLYSLSIILSYMQ
ncbi:unnamed protein product [Didymodactylos carnosus]|uniref:Ig-like domain-containing protein n=1 Tax=Didymodactylos carnosus TaxID=1234261 RepID=A0A8S2Q2S4_9BILA|nr:unnamed protein product [Didymodactylos carnosus]CAF4079003.1 unnamed protein product [Didymodactylos carnosus]